LTAGLDVAESSEGIHEFGEAGCFETFLAIATRGGRVASCLKTAACLILRAGKEVDARIAIAFANEGTETTSVSAVGIAETNFIETAVRLL